MRLLLGVKDVPYSDDVSPALTQTQARRARRNAVRAAFGLQEFHGTTGDVAELLEEKYHVMEVFYELHADDIAAEIEEKLGDAIEDMIGGAPIGSNSMIAAASEIERMFKEAIDKKEFDGVIGKVPTGAALKGVNHRLKHPYAKGNPERPSFKDTGLYQASATAWIE